MRADSRQRKRSQADRETRERLLQVAKQLFADRGFRNVTVREICRDAHANVAAVNYHFGDKLGLYRAVLQSAIDATELLEWACGVYVHARACGTPRELDDGERSAVASALATYGRRRA